jgi:hypothetical protein
MIDGIPNRPLYFYLMDIIGWNICILYSNHEARQVELGSSRSDLLIEQVSYFLGIDSIIRIFRDRTT